MKIPISNKDIPPSLFEKASAAAGNEEILFAICGDLDSGSRYSESLLLATKSKVISLDGENAEVFSASFEEIEDAAVKRMYGNAVLSVKIGGKRKNIFRCTYACASHAEAAAVFICAASSGKDFSDELGALEDSFEKEKRICPNCGRTLSSPGAVCYGCAGRGKMVRKFWKYIRPQLPALVVALVLSLVTTSITLLPPYITKMLVDDIIPSGEVNSLFLVVGFLFISYLVLFILSSIRNYMLRVSGNSIVASLKTDIYEHAQYLSMKFYDKTSTGAVINRINGDTATIQAFIMRISQEVIVQFFTLIGIIAIMMFMNWKLTLLALIPVPIIVFCSLRFSNYIAPFYRRIWRRGAAVSSLLTDTIPCVRVVKSFSGEKRASSKFRKYMDEWFKTDKRFAPVLSAYPAGINLAVNTGCILIWLIGGQNVIHNPTSLSLGTLVSFLTYTGLFYGPVNFFATLNDTYQGAVASAERIMDILDAEPEADFGKGKRPSKIDGKIEFSHVNFAFDKSKKVLSDVNLTIEKGDIVGIVGTTGSGKSTLINLLLRFYDSYEGKILIDGTDLRDIDLSYWRSCVGYVQQEPMMFHDTIFNNIAYGSQNARVEEVIAAADIANAHEFIARCPDGYDSVLGERGVGLSGGERQRISIARAVLKNPGILIFDEATAAVDSETEHLIQEAIDRLIAGRTTLMIAHRLSTLARANKIVVVDQGEIIECGPPAELLAKKGKYYRLVQIQSAGQGQIDGSGAEDSLLH